MRLRVLTFAAVVKLAAPTLFRHNNDLDVDVDDDLALTTELYVNTTAHEAELYQLAFAAGDMDAAADVWDRWRTASRNYRLAAKAAATVRSGRWFNDDDDQPAPTAVLRSAPLLSEVERTCDASELNNWLSHKDAQDVFQTWQKNRPAGLVYAHWLSSSCVARGLTGVGTTRPLLANTQILSLVHQSSDAICQDNDVPTTWFEPEVFPVPQALADKGHGPSRNYVGVWPPAGVCTKLSPCPVVFFLSGIGEHSSWDGAGNRPALDSFAKIQKWGYLRYVERDPDCLNRLGSYLLFPQLDRDENWLHDGKDMVGLFSIPLLWNLARKNPGKLDVDKISIIGYSEGAFGSLQAAAHFPYVFTLAVAASVSTSQDFWQQVQFNTTPPEKSYLSMSLKANATQKFALKSVIVALGEFDNTGSQPYNLQSVLSWMDLAGVMQQAALEFRYYAGLYHKEVWDRLFNRWDRFHEVFWLGNYSAIFQTSDDVL